MKILYFHFMSLILLFWGQVYAQEQSHLSRFCSSLLQSQAGVAQSFVWDNEVLLNQDQLVRFSQILKEDRFFETPIFEKNPKLLWLVFSQLPEELKNIFKYLPNRKSKAVLFVSTLESSLGAKQTFISTLKNHIGLWYRDREIPGVLNKIKSSIYRTYMGLPHPAHDYYSHWLFDGIKSLGELFHEEHKKLEELALALSIKSVANNLWRRSVEQVSVQSEGQTSFVIIGEQRYFGKIKNKEIWLQVPREKIKHPAWNPMNHEQLRRLMENRYRDIPKQYEAILGLDGNFYLRDGNHRFYLFHQDPMVWVKLPFPLVTTSWKGHLELVGLTSIHPEVVSELYQGNLSLEDVISSDTLRSLIFKPKYKN